jgi:hypothetical protein
MIFRLGQLPITLTSMTTHGHEDERYVPYLNELWPNDPNFIIGSLLWLFLTLEVALIVESKLLFEKPHVTHSMFFFLQGKSPCVHELCMLEKNIGTKPLPKNLLLQMDNYMKNNKN